MGLKSGYSKYILIIFIVCSIVQLSNAQVANKNAKKELKYYKKHINEYIYFKQDFRHKDSIVVDLEEENSRLRAELDLLRQQKESTSTSNEVDKTYVDTRVMPPGKSFQIQVGLYRNTELSGYLSEPKYLGYELDNDLIRYHIGYFNTYVEAKNFIDIIKKMGITDAFITEYFDGERINYTNTISNEKAVSPVIIKNKNTTTKNRVVNTENKDNNWDISKDEDENNEEIKVNNNKTTNTTTKTTTKTTDNNSDEKFKMQDNWKLETDEYGNEIIKIIPKR